MNLLFNSCHSALLHSVTRMWMTRQIFITNCLWSIQRLSTWVSNLPCHCLVQIFMLDPITEQVFLFRKQYQQFENIRSVMQLKSPWHCIPDMGSGRDDGSALCLSGGQTTNHTSMNLVGPSRMAFLGHGIIYKAVFGPRGNVRYLSTAFVHKMEVIHVLWPITYWVPLKRVWNHVLQKKLNSDRKSI